MGKSGFSKHQRKQLLSLSALLGLTFLIFCGIMAVQRTEQTEKRELLTSELSSFMSFYEFNAAQWENYFAQQGFGKKVSGAELVTFCRRIGISEYVEDEHFPKNCIVSYEEFLPVYERILYLLDTDHQVGTKEVKIDGRPCQVYSMGERIIGFKSFVKKHTISEVLASQKEHSDSDQISVALKNGATYYRETLYLKVNSPYKKVMANKKEKVVKKNAIFKFTKKGKVSNPKKNECVTLIPESSSGRIFIVNKSGELLSKGYRGTMRIYRYKNGYVLINELTVKEYLYGVLPSEMPASFEKEALKAQAVCARSYVYRQMEQVNAPSKFYAQVDDTTAFQVYNKSEESAVCNKAVNETKNKVLKYKGKIATTYYYSTSCGIRQSYEIWKLDKNSGGYLRSGLIHKKAKEFGGTKSVPNLSKEKDFRKFMENKDGNFFEKDCRYYRWTATATYKDKEAVLSNAISKRKVAAPASVTILDAKGKEDSSVNELGKIKKIAVTERYASGTIAQVTITYEHGKVLLQNEYTIRMCLATFEMKLSLQDNSHVACELLPSATFYIKSQKNGKITISGGGFGHGLGLSQFGANELAKNGYGYKDILYFFYQDVTM